MDTGRLKTAAILILLLTDLAFGWILLTQRKNAADLQAHSRRELIRVLADMGVDLAEDRIPAETERDVYAAIRDHEAETALARAFLGNVEGRDLGGNIHYFENENGRASFRSTGDFELLVTAAGASIEKRLADSGVNVVRDGEEYIWLMEGRQVFNCRIRLSAMADGSYRISGKCVLGAVQPDRTVTVPGAATLLLRFREQVEESGRVFTRIRAIRSGFLLQPSAYSSELFPVWRIETDGGTWCVSAEDGKLLSELT